MRSQFLARHSFCIAPLAVAQCLRISALQDSIVLLPMPTEGGRALRSLLL
jgi:hypothetical protein